MIARLVVFLLFFSNTLSLNYVNLGLTIVRNKIENIIEIGGQNTICAKHMKILISHFMRGQQWALTMADASAKLNAGVMRGSFIHIGHYDECLEIDQTLELENTTIKGQYCNLIISPSEKLDNNSTFPSNFGELIKNLNVDIPANPLYKYVKDFNQVPYGVCLPTSCKIENLQSMWNYAESTLSTKLHFKFKEALCDSREKPHPNNQFDFYIWLFFGLLMVFYIIATIYDVVFGNKGNRRNSRLLVAFSLCSNFKQLFSTTSSKNSISCINGVKVLSILWLIIGQRILLNIIFIPSNILDMIPEVKTYQFMFITSSHMAVDTLLFLNGFLVVYIFRKYKNQGIQINVTKLYLSRIIRLTPPLIGIILFNLGIWKYLGYGPFWKPISQVISGNCLKSWWSALLFIDNMKPITDTCFPHSWYLSMETQLYILVPIIFFCFKKHIKGITTLICVILLSSLYSYIITVSYNLGAVPIEMEAEYYRLYYTKAYTRIGPWLIGLLFGLLITKLKERHVHIPKILNLILWILSLTTILYIILPWHKSFTASYDVYRSATFNALARPIWALCIGWIIFACSSGNGGWVNDVLSLPVFTVLGKLQYSTFLIQFSVLLHRNASQQTNVYHSHLEYFYDVCGDFLFIFLASTTFYLLMEAPVIVLRKIYLKSGTSNQSVTRGTNTDKGSHKKKSKKKYILCIIPENSKIENVKEELKKIE